MSSATLGLQCCLQVLVGDVEVAVTQVVANGEQCSLMGELYDVDKASL
jgi:hypothetical protein